MQIDVVTCKLDGRVYVRKSTEKRFALRTRDVSYSVQLFGLHFNLTDSNAPHNLSVIFFSLPLKGTRHGFLIYSVHSSPQHILTLSWTMLKAGLFGMFLSPVRMTAE